MKKTIINKQQLEHLVDIGVLYKCKDGTYQPLINHKVWGYECMPKNMVYDVAGKTVDVKIDKSGDDEADRWVTDDAQGWYIQPWMLVDYYDKIKQWGKYRPVPRKKGDEPGMDKYTLHIISRTRLDRLVEKGIVKKEKFGAMYIYIPIITDMGGLNMPDTMAEQICGKTIDCNGTGTTWVEEETEHRWSISQWMLDNNYEYLLSRKEGYLDTGEFEDEEEEEEEEPEEEEDEEEPKEEYKRNNVYVAGKIIEKTDNTIIVSTDYTDVLVRLDKHDCEVGLRVGVNGYLVRTENMMGYPEIKCTHIEEV